MKLRMPRQWAKLVPLLRTLCLAAAFTFATAAACTQERGFEVVTPSATSPTQLVAAAQTGFSQAVVAATEASNQGLLSAATEVRIDTLIHRVAPALTAANLGASGGSCADPGPDPSIGQAALACWQKWLAIATAGIEQIRLAVVAR